MDEQACPLLNIAWSVTYTIFTQMQDDPSNGTYAQKKTYFTINFIHLIHKTCQVLGTFTIRLSLSTSSQAVPSFSHTHCEHSYPLH